MKKKTIENFLHGGAEGGNRTHMRLPSRVFETRASACSATSTDGVIKILASPGIVGKGFFWVHNIPVVVVVSKEEEEEEEEAGRFLKRIDCF